MQAGGRYPVGHQHLHAAERSDAGESVLTKRAAWRQRNGTAGRADGDSAYQHYFEPTRAKAFFNGNPIHGYKRAVGVDVYPKHVKRPKCKLILLETPD
jgi:hypothetical protein